MSRSHALAIFRAAVRAADPKQAVLSHVKIEGRTLIAGKQRYRLSDFDRIRVIGAGKASARMASGARAYFRKTNQRRLGERPDGDKGGKKVRHAEL